MSTRPTSDRLRETLFNVLGPRVQAARFADLYAGSGAVGIEALSRGAAHSFFAEQAAAALEALRSNLESLGLVNLNRASISVGKVIPALTKGIGEPFDVVFLDPPYEAAAEYQLALHALAAQHERLLVPGAVVIAEHAKRNALLERYGFLERTRVLQQGDAALSFFAIRLPEPGPTQVGI